MPEIARTCNGCGAELTGAQQFYCSMRCKRRVWRRDPERAERDRESARQWKAAHPQETARYDHNRARAIAGTCDQCGGRLGAGVRAGTCMPCRKERRHQHALLIQQMWSAGATLQEIADKIGWTAGGLGVEMARLRKDERYDLPYRYAALRNRQAA